MRTRLVLRDGFIGAAGAGHPLLSGAVAAERYAACRHVAASRRGGFTSPVDDALAELGLSRDTMVVVPGFSDALRIARHSDLIALVSDSGFRNHTAGLKGIIAFALPVPTPGIAVSAIWHPRTDADPVHRLLRETVIVTCHDLTSDS